MIDRIQKWLPVLTLHALLVALPLLFTASTEELFEFPKILFVYGAATLLVFSWLFAAIKSRKLALPRTPFDYPILAFLLSQCLSTIFSINVHTSLFGYYSRFNGGLLSVLAYIVIFYAFTIYTTKKTLPIMLRSIFIGGILTALYAFPEHFGHSPSCFLLTTDHSFTADCWVQDVQNRIFGTLGQPNWLAAYMVVLLPLTVAKLQTIDYKKQIWRTLGWISVFTLFSLVLVYTKSRSGILGAGIALGVLFLSTMVLEWTQKTTKKFQLSTFLPLFTLFVFGFFILAIANPVRDKFVQVFHVPQSQSAQTSEQPATGTQLESGGSESGDIRRVVWSGALKVWVRYPVFGSGVETFAYSYYKDRPKEHNLLSEWDFLYNKAHNEFLNYLATTGIIGLLSYLTMLGSFIVLPFVWIMRQRRGHVALTQKKYQTVIIDEEPTSSYQLQVAISCALIGLSISNFFGFSTVVVSMLTFALPALAVVIDGKLRIDDVDLQKMVRKKVIANVAIGVIFLATCYFLLATYGMYSVDVSYSQSKAMIDHQQVQDGVALLQRVVDTAPNEPVYRDELAYTAARLSYALGTTGDSTAAASLAQAAIDHSDEVLAQNNVNVNFYKTRARIFTLLGQISPVFYDQAVKALLRARELSPTDPKLTYNLALIAKAQGDEPGYERALQETIALRPIDLQARLDLAKAYEDEKKPDDAKREYNEVIKLDPNNKDAKDRIASLSAKTKK